MLKKIVILISIISLTLFLAGSGSGVLAISELEADQEEIQQERQVVQSKLSEAENELVKLVQQLEEVNRQLTNVNNAIEQNEAMIEEIQGKIKENERELQVLEEDMDLLQESIDLRVELLKDRASTYQRNGSNNASFLEVILGSESFGDFVSRLFMLSRIAQADNQFIEQLQSSQDELAETQGEYEETLLQLEDQLLILEILHEDIQEQKDNIVRLRNEVKANEAKQETLIKTLAEQDEQLSSKEAEIRNRIEEEVRRQEEARKEAERQAAEKAAQERAAQERAAASSTSSSNSPRPSTPPPPQTDDGWETFIATAYTAYCYGCSGITFTGIDLRANPDAKVIAVDPSVIPLGSYVEVKGYGVFLAADIGGAINGRKIDIFMPDRDDVIQFGIRTVQLRILD
ncbi:MAG: hypothetical protein LRY73_18895 [Bacillus sp. (in: Bacteria)]|nr:hypothetical protein [Bacillus sp. (in: firmicutes)]